MTTTTPTTALADLPDHRLDYIARQYFADDQYQQYVKHAIRDAFQEARRAAQPVAPSPQIAEVAELRRVEPGALASSIAELDAWLETDGCDPLTVGQGESVGLVLHELKRLRAICPECKGTGMADSGGTHPWGEPALIPCGCDAIAPSRRAVASPLPQARIEELYFAAVQQSENADDTEHTSIITRFARAIEREVPAPASAGQAAPAETSEKLQDELWAAIMKYSRDYSREYNAPSPSKERAETTKSRKKLDDIVSRVFAAQPAEGAGQAGQVAGAWHDAVFAECMKIETAYKADDPAGTVRALINWYYEEASGVSDGIKRLANNYMRLTCGTERAAAPADQLDEAAAYRMWRDCEIADDEWFADHLSDHLPRACIGRAPTAAEWDAAMLAVMRDRATHQPSAQVKP